MRGIVHPLKDELGGLVESEREQSADEKVDKDTSWRWMIGIAVVIGLLAWFTR